MKYLGLFYLIAFLTTHNSFSQSTYTTVSSGIWSDNIFIDEMGNLQSNPNDRNINIVIATGHTVILSDTKEMNNLTIQTGGKLFTNVITNRYLEIYGYSVIIDGTLGNGNPLAGGTYDGIGLEFHGTNNATCTISGNGTNTNIARLRKDGLGDQTIIIDVPIMNLHFNDPASSAIYSNALTGGARFDLIINQGRTVNLMGNDCNISIDGADGTNSSNRDGTITINGTLNVGGKIWCRSDNPAGNDITYSIGTNGKVVTRAIVGASGIAGNTTTHLNIASGGRLEINGIGTPVTDMDVTGNAFSFGSGCDIIYNGFGNQEIESSFPYEDLFIDGGAFKLLEGQTKIKGTLTFIAGSIICGDEDLIITSSGSITGANSNKYIITNGLGVLNQESISSVTNFPVGPNTTSYNPVIIDPGSTPDGFSVNVQTTVDHSVSDPTAMVNRQWNINEAIIGGNNGTVKFEWDSSHEGSNFNRDTDLLLGVWAGTFWNENTAVINGTNPFTASNTIPISEFSSFIVSNAVALPLELIEFNVTPENRYVKLNWEILFVHDVTSLELQKSDYHNNWHTLRQWNTQELTYGSYQFIDKRPDHGINYYRLLWKDFNGSVNYSKTEAIKINLSKEDLVRIYPTPAKQQITIEFNDAIPKGADYQIINALGQILIYENLTVTKTTIDITALQNGQYWIRFMGIDDAPILSFIKHE